MRDLVRSHLGFTGCLLNLCSSLLNIGNTLVYGTLNHILDLFDGFIGLVCSGNRFLKALFSLVRHPVIHLSRFVGLFGCIGNCIGDRLMQCLNLLFRLFC